MADVYKKLAWDAEVMKAALLDANSIIKADSDNTPVALAVGASTIVGRKATGNIVALTGAEALAIAGGAASSHTHGSSGIDDGSVTVAKLAAAASGSYLIAAADYEAIVTGTTYTKKKEIFVPRAGVYTVYFSFRRLSAAGTAYARIYVNGVATGTERRTSTSPAAYIENITVTQNALIQLYLKGSGDAVSSGGSLFRIYEAAPLVPFVLQNDSG